MPHYNAYDSFKTKKSLDKKQKAKEKALGKKNDESIEFVVKNSQDCGIVIEVRYNDAYVLYNNEIVIAKLRKDINLACNQVVFPGDKVLLDKVNDTFIIQNMVKRTSLLSRVKKDSTRLDDVGLTKNVAANVDLAVIVVAAKEPPLHPKFIDRYLMILQNSNIPAIVCLNKCDLKTEEEEKILDVYREIGIPVIETSAYKNIGIEELKSYLKCSDTIAKTTYEQFQNMSLDKNCTPAILSYSGIQYQYMAPHVFTDDQMKYIQEHLYILSGFYGLFRSLVAITP